MQLALQISFHGLPSSESVEGDVRERVADLETAFPRLTSCRVSIEMPHRHRQQGRRYQVRVELRAPGLAPIVGEAADDNADHEDVSIAVRDAFRAARRQLE